MDGLYFCLVFQLTPDFLKVFHVPLFLCLRWRLLGVGLVGVVGSTVEGVVTACFLAWDCSRIKSATACCETSACTNTSVSVGVITRLLNIAWACLSLLRPAACCSKLESKLLIIFAVSG